MHALIATLFVFAQDPAPAANPTGFRSISFENALVASRDEKRVVLLAFLGAGAPETQRMEETVWSDPVMQRWLEARTVALRIDPLQQPELAERFRIQSLPCTVLAVPSGDEVERVTGVFDARRFMQTEQFDLRSAEVIAAARKPTIERPADFVALVELGRAYYGMRRAERASECFLEAWDRGLADRSFDEYRRSLLAWQFASCVTALPEFKKKIASRRDAARERLLKLTEGDDHVGLALDVGALNRALAAAGKQTETWRALRDREDAPKAVVEALFIAEVERFLYNGKFFDELVAGRGDVLAYIDSLYARLAAEELEAAKREMSDSEGIDPAAQPALDPVMVRRNGTLSIAAMYLEALGASAQASQTRDVARIVTAFDRRPEAYIGIVNAVARAGKLDEARELAAEGRAALAGSPEGLAQLERGVQQALGSKR